MKYPVYRLYSVVMHVMYMYYIFANAIPLERGRIYISMVALLRCKIWSVRFGFDHLAHAQMSSVVDILVFCIMKSPFDTSATDVMCNTGFSFDMNLIQLHAFVI